MQSRLIVFLVAMLVGSSSAQNSRAKLDVRLKLLADLQLRERPAPALQKTAGLDRAYLSVLILGEPARVRTAVEAVGGRIGSLIGRISTARVSPLRIGDLSTYSGVERIERSSPKRVRNDRVIRDTGGLGVHQGQAPLTRRYRGDGVLVGIIDTGLDFKHRDFRNAASPGESRVLSIWDQEDNGPGSTPQGYHYGTLWTQAEIEQTIGGGDIVRHRDTDGHGTHVAGTAVGNGGAIGRYSGMAPNADIIGVAGIDFTVDATAYIFREAERLGVPAVVNYSASSHFGPHDGSTLEELALDVLVAEKRGRAFVTAAGNEGDAFLHWGGFNLEADSVWTYYHADVFLFPPEKTPHGDAMVTEVNGTVETPDAGNTFIAIGLDSTAYEDFFVEPRGYHGQTGWRDLRGLVDLPGSASDTLRYANGELAAAIDFTAVELDNGKIHFWVVMTDFVFRIDVDDPVSGIGVDLFRLVAKGSGEIHVWSENVLTAEHPYVDFPVLHERYRKTDNHNSVGIPGTGKNVIAVGAYVNGAGDGKIVGSLATFSSRGPTADGRIKPEVVGPGVNVTSSLSSDADASEFVVVTGGTHHTLSGTSSAAPVITGAIALFLEKNPTATVAQIRDALTTHTTRGGFVASSGMLPNADWGHGRVDILSAMTGGAAAAGTPTSFAAIGPGESEAGHIDDFNPHRLYHLTLSDNQDVIIDLVPEFDAVLWLYAGADVAAVEPSRLLFLVDNAFGAEQLVIGLEGGDYLIVVTPFGPEETGTFSLDVSSINVARRLLSVSLNEQTRGRLESEQSEDLYQVDLAANTELAVKLDSDFDAILSLYRGHEESDAVATNRVVFRDGSTESESFRRHVAAGLYLVAVSSFSGSGDYTLAVDGVLLGPVVDLGQPVVSAEAARSDFDGDGVVGFADFLTFAGSFGVSEGCPTFDPPLDLDQDGAVAFSDFLIFAGDFGKLVSTKRIVARSINRKARSAP